MPLGMVMLFCLLLAGCATPQPTRVPLQPPTELLAVWHATSCCEGLAARVCGILESFNGVCLTPEER